MKWAKLAPLFMLALVIDGFQFLISIALMVMGAFPGTIAGCAIGQQVAGDAGCFVLGLVGTIPFINGVLAAGFAPIGIALGFTISICISFVFGSILVLLLQLAGVLDKRAALGAYIGEVIPGIDMLPAWTGLVVLCAIKDLKGEVMGRTVLNAAMSIGSTLVLPNTPIGNAMQQGTLSSRATIVRAQPTYGNAEQNVTRTESSRNLPMQDMRIRPRQATNDNKRTELKADNDNLTPYAQAA